MNPSYTRISASLIVAIAFATTQFTRCMRYLGKFTFFDMESHVPSHLPLYSIPSYCTLVVVLHARSLVGNSSKSLTSDALNHTPENEEVGSSRPRIYSQLLLDVLSPN